MARLDADDKYLSLLKKSLLNELYLENEARIALLINTMLMTDNRDVASLTQQFLGIAQHPVFGALKKTREEGSFVTRTVQLPDGTREEWLPARNFTFVAHSMVGRKRMDNLHQCMNAVVEDGVPGDFIETGVWRGGCTIFMRGFLHHHGIDDRVVWVADSFEGLPPPTHRQDEGFDFTGFPYLSVGLDEVRELFARYDLLDTQVKFLKGWFKDTLPTAPIERLAILRLDGDLYESTMDALGSLYGKLAPGGFCIVDDYYAVPPCEKAVSDFRAAHGIVDELVRIDNDSAYWRKR
jgi:O-methyltransferase